MRLRRLGLLAAFCAGLFAQSTVAVWAQGFPSRAITFVVPFPPGGSIDVTLRAMAPRLQERLGRPVVIENRAGAGGVIATTSVAKSQPDGHTILAAPNLVAANPKLYKSLPFDTVKDLQMVLLLFHSPLIFVSNLDLPAKTVTELIALLKRSPGEISYAHAGPGSALHLAAELFQTMSGTRMNGVAYRGAPLGLNDVIAGHVKVMFADSGTVVEQITAGKVNALGVSATTRLPIAPSIPTIAEAGVPGFDAVGWTMLCVPSATPKPIIDRLHAELKAVAETPEISALLVKLGAVPVISGPPPELQRFLASEIDRLGGIIETAGIAKSL